ncbi:MAG: aminoglycoside phosphotransferase family protein [Candidatus Limnocylindrales bacterium]
MHDDASLWEVLEDEPGYGPERWTSAAWLAGARAWIIGKVADLGHVVNGEIEQPHVRWWSTVLRVPTTDGVVWFKASGPTGIFESRLDALLSSGWPDASAQVVAADTDRGWMLARDAGVRLRDVEGGRAPVEHWSEVLPRYAEIQVGLGNQQAKLRDLGVPDLGLARLPGLLRTLLEQPDLLGSEANGGLSRDDFARIRARVAEFGDRCRRLSAMGIPESLQHDDLHDGNVFVRDGGYVIFDWGDACLSHPFHTLVVTLRSLAYSKGWAPGGPEVTRLRDAYLEPWGSFGSASDLLEAAELARRTGTVQRSIAWARLIASLPAVARAEDVETISYGLRLYLLDGPFGSWDDGTF